MGWIGVDLDGTLAHYTGWKGADNIGPPVPAMLNRVMDWLNAGKDVKVFTARVSAPEQEAPIRAWLIENLGEEKAARVGITNVKDFAMIELWDDRAIQVEINTGRRVDGKP